MTSTHRSIGRVACLVLLLAAGCGGGTGNIEFRFPDTQPIVAPSGVALAYGPRRVDVSWFPVSGAGSYTVVEDPDGPGPLPSTVVGAVTGTTFQFPLRALLADRLNATYGVQACRGSAATSCSDVSLPVAIDASQAIGYLKAGNADAGDAYGSSVALSDDGKTLAIGAPAEGSAPETSINGDGASNAAPAAGAVYLWRRSGALWQSLGLLKASNVGTGDRFGTSVALSGDGTVVAVGAPGEDGGSRGVNGIQADESAQDSGAVYTYSISANPGGAMFQTAYLKSATARAGDRFGTAVRLSKAGNVLAVGAPGEPSAATGVNGNAADGSAPNAGAAYVFVNATGAWAQRAYVKASNAQAGDLFGAELALSGDGSVLAVAARGEASAATGVDGAQADNTAPSAGAVYVFASNGSTGFNWAQQAYLKASNTGAGDRFGAALALSSDGSLLAVGAPNEGAAGAGPSVNPADNSAADAGAVYVFRRVNAWSLETYLKPGNAAAGQLYGSSLSLSAVQGVPLLAVGAPGEAGAGSGLAADPSSRGAPSAGAAYLYRFVGTNWLQHAYLKASNASAGDRFGIVQLSGDGTTLLVGAPGEAGADQAAPGAGAAYLY